MSHCANCGNIFLMKSGSKGYYRFSFEKTLPSIGTLARQELEKMTGQPITPMSKKLKGHFLCPQCWNLLNTGAKYKTACRSFFGKTSSPAYLAKKRPRTSSISSPGSALKRPRFTSTPLHHNSSAARSIFSESSRPKQSTK